MFTIGVEEEFLLLGPDGVVAPVALDVVRGVNRESSVKSEFMPFQVETNTAVWTRLEDLRSDLQQLRRVAAAGAGAAGALLVASGMPPYDVGEINYAPSAGRYDEIRRRFPQAVPSLVSCSCHVHVGLADRDLGAAVLTRLRPWLATLLALTGNSPVAEGRDTGWSSRRYVEQLSWPTFRPPGCWSDAAAYDRAVRRLLAHGAAADQRSVYFLSRLSPRYPTVEVRIADTCLAVDDAVLLAGVVRALIVRLCQDTRDGVRIEAVDPPTLCAGLLSAARDGMTVIADGSGRPTPKTVPSLTKLQETIDGALDRAGDGAFVREGLDRLRRDGNGADRQRALWLRADAPREFVRALADRTLPT